MKQGHLENCKGSNCENGGCCIDGYAELISEFENSKRQEIKEKLLELGVIITKEGHYEYRIKNCSDGTDCLLLKHFSKQEDVRSLACKIYPYKHIDITCGEDKYVGIYLRNRCPATRPNFSVPGLFTDEVIELVKEHYLKHNQRKVEVVITNGFQEC